MLLNKLYASLWKCWRIRCRHYLITIFVIFIPILLYGLLAWGRTKLGHISKQYVNETTYVDAMSEEYLYSQYKVDIANTYLLYSPSSEFSNKLMREVQLQMDITNHSMFISLNVSPSDFFKMIVWVFQNFTPSIQKLICLHFTTII